VLLWHCAIRTPGWVGDLGLLRVPALMGWAGVDLFFALSGFLITGLVLDEERATGRIDLRSFYVRRALRIFPAFYLVLLVDLLVLQPAGFGSVGGGLAHGAMELLSLATYWSNYFYAYGPQALPPPALAVFWSLCVEEHFYLLWPAVLLAVRRARTRLLAAASVCAVLPLARHYAALVHPDPDVGVRFLSHFRLDSLLWGALAALALAALRQRRRLAPLVLAGSAGVVGALIATRQLAGYLTPLGYSLGFTGLAVFGTALATEVTQAPAAPLARLFSLAPLRALGRVSYGMYLIHFPVIDLVHPRLFAFFAPRRGGAYTLLLTAAVTAVSFAVAWTMNRFYERPFLRFKERFTPPREPLGAALAARGETPAA
jgi:peptidoglycan/LPS O-acetylase OafA/YrhL